MRLKYKFTIFLTLFFLLFYSSANFAIEDVSIEYSDSINSSDLCIDSGSGILVDANSSKVLYEKNSHSKLRPASVTKVMTILLIMEAIDSGQISYDTKISCSEKAASMGGSQIWLEVRRNFNCR